MEDFRIKKSKGIGAWDATRGGGPQATGLATAEIVDIAYEAKKRVIQGTVKMTISSPTDRVGEEITAYVNIAPRTDEEKTIKACEESVALLLAAGGVVDEGSVKDSEYEFSGAQLRQALVGKSVPVHTYEGTEDMYGQVEILTPSMATEIQTGERKPPADRRRKKGANAGQQMMAAGGGANPFGGGATPGGNAGGNPFGGGATPGGGGGAAAGGNPFGGGGGGGAAGSNPFG